MSQELLLTVLSSAVKLAIVQETELVEETEEEEVEEDNEEEEEDGEEDDDDDEATDEEMVTEDDDNASDDMDNSEDVSVGVEKSAKSAKYVKQFCSVELLFLINIVSANYLRGLLIWKTWIQLLRMLNRFSFFFDVNYSSIGAAYQASVNVEYMTEVLLMVT
jgi:hypothetical protein